MKSPHDTTGLSERRPSAYGLLRGFAILLIAIHPLSVNSAQTNLLTNGDFETSSGAYPANWGTQVAPGNPSPSFSWATDRSVSSIHSLKTIVSADGTADWRQTNIPVDANIQYRLRAHVYATNVSNGSHAVEVQWFTGSTYLGRSVVTASVADKWIEASLEHITPPTGATVAHILLRTYKTGTYYFDDVCLLREDKQLILNDGKFPMGLYSLTSVGLLSNGDTEFKDLSKGNNPANWGATVDPTASAVFTWDSVRKQSGERSLKINMISNGPPAHWGQSVTNIDPNKRYRFSAYIYADNITTGSHSAELQWFNGTQYLGRQQFFSTNVNSWTYVGGVNIAPIAGANTVYVLMRGYKNGNYWFDNIRFEEDRTEVERVTEAVNAGFNLIVGGASMNSIGAGGAKAVAAFSDETYQDTSAISSAVDGVENHSALRFYYPPGEPAWWDIPLPASTVVDGYQTIVNSDASYHSAPHRVWLNHAPRGTQADPTNFSLLKPYSAGADIVSMDIYPIPNGDHSNLPNKTISCVGDYVDILYNQVVSEGNVQKKPIWMLLQASSMSDYNPLYYSHSVQIQWFDQLDKFIGTEVLACTKTNTWVTVSQTGIIPPANARKAVIVLRSLAPGTYRFDNISVTENGITRTTNGNVESGVGADPANWTKVVGTGSTVQSWDTQVASSPSHSLKTVMNSWGSADWQQAITSIDPTKTYNFSVDIHTDNASPYPRPNWLQTRFMAYNAIIHGARGLIYWGNSFIRTSDPLWTDLKAIASEIRTLSDILGMPVSYRKVTTTNSNLETLLLSSASDTHIYLLVANRSNTNLTNVTISWSGLSTPSGKEFLENQPVTITNNSFVKSFSPYQVNVFELTKAP